MSILFYYLFLWLYSFAIRVASIVNPKAALWINGRKNILQKIKSTLPHNEKRVWMHCASLGEFEQGRPVLEAIRKQYPDYKIVLTFFSPSGYEVRKDYDGADYVFYLPVDSKRNAKVFLDAVNPLLVLFVKYEFWYFYLSEIKRRKIPSILISAAFRENQAFFKWYGGFFRKMLHGFTHILVQDKRSFRLLSGIGITENVAVAGDTRYDRVLEIAANAKDLPEIASFKGNYKLLIGGSTWPEDENTLKAILGILPDEWRLVLAPHEIDKAHIIQVQSLFGHEAILFSEYKQQPATEKRVLIVDNIGMLSNLYRYGEIAFIGGGFNKGGIHNVLEPAVFGLPVIIGPVYEKFVEAVELVNDELAFVARDETEAKTILATLIANDVKRDDLHEQLKKFTIEHAGATKAIMRLIEQMLGKQMGKA